MAYVDGFVIPVPYDKREAYLKMAKLAADIYKENGALEIIEAWGDDVPEGKLTSFSMAVKLEPDESVIFSWVKWPSKAVRDAGNAKVMADPRMSGFDLPFDGKRLIFGGFEIISDER
jgi:uncharacterized protein YbaA (DUF1428 family)